MLNTQMMPRGMEAASQFRSLRFLASPLPACLVPVRPSHATWEEFPPVGWTERGRLGVGTSRCSFHHVCFAAGD